MEPKSLLLQLLLDLDLFQPRLLLHGPTTSFIIQSPPLRVFILSASTGLLLDRHPGSSGLLTLTLSLSKDTTTLLIQFGTLKEE